MYSIAIFFVFFNLLHSKVLLTPFPGDLSNDQINSGSISLLFPTIPGQNCNCDITITFLTVYPPCMHVHCVHSYSSFCFFVQVKSKLKSNYKMSLFITLSFESDILLPPSSFTESELLSWSKWILKTWYWQIIWNKYWNTKLWYLCCML